MKVTEGIEYVDETSPAHIYVLDDDGEITLIDAGLPNEAPKVLDYLKRTGRTPQQVKRILLTHRHGDHAGAVSELAQATGAEVYAHEDEAAAVEAQAGAPKGVKRLKDGDELPVLGGLRAIEVPGHTTGHLCFYAPRHKALFTGDAMINRGSLTGPVPQYTSDLTRAHGSLREKVLPLDVELLCVAHGEVMQSGTPAALKQMIGSLA
ncbi:MAG TPA: MBL fold metallo-hydrolase [Chloroflexota bacterium]|nr:MBL fold metallo-hydrolase [Chloroflexota bacterium]